MLRFRNYWSVQHDLCTWKHTPFFYEWTTPCKPADFSLKSRILLSDTYTGWHLFSCLQYGNPGKHADFKARNRTENSRLPNVTACRLNVSSSSLAFSRRRHQCRQTPEVMSLVMMHAQCYARKIRCTDLMKHEEMIDNISQHRKRLQGSRGPDNVNYSKNGICIPWFPLFWKLQFWHICCSEGKP